MLKFKDIIAENNNPSLREVKIEDSFVNRFVETAFPFIVSTAMSWFYSG